MKIFTHFRKFTGSNNIYPGSEKSSKNKFWPEQEKPGNTPDKHKQSLNTKK